MSLKNALGGILLIVGTSVGAAVLALPIATANLGFVGSALTYAACWFFMTVGALCILEANLKVGLGTNMISMSEHFLGASGKWITWGTYLILFYALTASYLAGASSWIIQGLAYYNIIISSHSAAIIATILVMGIIFCGTHITDLINRILMIGLFGTFFLLSIITLPAVEPALLWSSPIQFQIQPLPLIITAFGYAIIVPTLVNYLKGQRKQLYRVILWGSLIPLFMYLLWQILILGTLPLQGDISLESIAHSGDPVVALPKQLNLKFEFPAISLTMSYFSIFALFTSILGVCLSLFDFLADGLKIKKNLYGKLTLSAVTFIPPLIFVYCYPKGFTFALSFAGIFVSVLLGILPAVMVWKLSNQQATRTALGFINNKYLLGITILFFTSIIGIECIEIYEQLR